MTTVKQYLAQNGYTSVEDWAIDSDFHYNPTTTEWTNDDGEVTDIPSITEYLAVLISEGKAQ